MKYHQIVKFLVWFGMIQFAFGGGIASAKSLKVVASIGPVYGVVAAVGEGVVEPQLLVSQTASPHGYQMTPKQRLSLSQADLVVWVGPSIEPFIARPLSQQDGDASLSWLKLEGARLLEGDGHDHDHHGDEHGDEHEDEHHDEHGHDEHDDEKHHDDEHGEDKHADEKHHDDDEHAAKEHDDDEHGHDEHADEKHDDQDHDEHTDDKHAGTKHSDDDAHHDDEDDLSLDPHVWMDIDNAILLANAVATRLTELDPENKARFDENRSKFESQLRALDGQISQQLSLVAGRKYVVYHNAYSYFESRYGLGHEGVVTVNEELPTSAAAIVDLRKDMRSNDVVCVFSEPQFSSKSVQRLVEGLEVKSSVLDPLGSDIPLNASFYPTLIKQLSDQFSNCLKEN